VHVGPEVTPKTLSRSAYTSVSGIGGFDIIEREHHRADGRRPAKDLSVFYSGGNHQPGRPRSMRFGARAERSHRHGLHYPARIPSAILSRIIQHNDADVMIAGRL